MSEETSTRLSMYKLRSKTASCQEERRRQLLEQQKRLRQESFNEGRRILEEFSVDLRCKKLRSKIYRKQFMNSEWFLDIPNDFEDNWYMKPCPVGKRVLVVAHRGETTTFDKRGTVLAVHPTLLPAGNDHQEVHTKGATILDCIWNETTKAYYVLDVLAWKHHPVINCDAEFRFYWLQSKFKDEIEEISEKLARNPHPVHLLPHFDCDRGTLDTVVGNPSLVPSVLIDGFLFYHKQAHYTAGTTPLVLWLKPFMAVDVLHMSVAENLRWELPTNYQGYKQYICDYEVQAAKKRRSRGHNFHRKGKKMEVDNTEGGVPEEDADISEQAGKDVMEEENVLELNNSCCEVEFENNFVKE